MEWHYRFSQRYSVYLLNKFCYIGTENKANVDSAFCGVKLGVSDTV
jgi:hypothetical protein